MALPNKVIKLRSPYFLARKGSDLKSMFVDLYVWNGDFVDDKPEEPTFSLYSTALFNTGSGANVAQIDIASFAEDYVETNYTTNQDSNSVFIYYDEFYLNDGDEEFTVGNSDEFIGLAGYSYYEDGSNYDVQPEILSATREYTLPSYNQSDGIYIPCLSNNLQKIEYYDYFVSFDTTTFTVPPFFTKTITSTPTSSGDVITYVPSYNKSGDTKTIVITFTTGNTYVIRLREYKGLCGMESILMSFVNSFGANENMWFLGNNKTSVSTRRESYNRSTQVFGGYDIDKPQNTALSLTGELNLTLNTGFVNQEVNPAMQEMMLSKNIWTSIPENLLGVPAYYSNGSPYVSPVHIVNQNLVFETDRLTKLINYTVQLKSSVNRFNNNR